MPAATFGMGLGTAIAGTAAAGASVAGAKMNSNASKDASRIQADAAQKALDEKKRLFDIEQAQRKPYLDASTAALGRLGQSAGQPVNLPAAYQNPYAPKPQTPAQPQMLGSMGQMTPRQGGMSPQGQPMAPQSPPQAPQGDLVTVQAPNGQTARLPREQAQMAVQRGARVIQ